MERILFEYVAYVWSKSKERYVQLGISLSESYDICKKVYEMHRKEWQSNINDYDFDKYEIRYRKVSYTDWEVIYE